MHYSTEPSYYSNWQPEHKIAPYYNFALKFIVTITGIPTALGDTLEEILTREGIQEAKTATTDANSRLERRLLIQTYRWYLAEKKRSTYTFTVFRELYYAINNKDYLTDFEHTAMRSQRELLLEISFKVFFSAMINENFKRIPKSAYPLIAKLYGRSSDLKELIAADKESYFSSFRRYEQRCYDSAGFWERGALSVDRPTNDISSRVDRFEQKAATNQEHANRTRQMALMRKAKALIHSVDSLEKILEFGS